jgi:hypothetical protein
MFSFTHISVLFINCFSNSQLRYSDYITVQTSEIATEYPETRTFRHQLILMMLYQLILTAMMQALQQEWQLTPMKRV